MQWGTTASAITDQLGEDHGVVVLLVVSGVDDRHRPLVRAAAQILDSLALAFKLAAVARAKLAEALGNVVKPSAKLVAGRSSRAHSSKLARSWETPRGQTWSINTR